MNKETQMYVGIAVVAVGSFLLYNNWKKKQAVTAVKATFVKNNPASMKKMAGMVGMDAKMEFVAGNAIVKDSRFAFADGSQSIAPTFFDVQDSPNSFRNSDGFARNRRKDIRRVKKLMRQIIPGTEYGSGGSSYTYE